MNGLIMMAIAIVVLLAAYLIYGRYLARTWGIDPKAKTPAYEFEDGVDYVPADTNVVFGHQFASIAGAGPITGPIQAAIFGWVPVLLWILVGGVFFGAVQDFSAMYASVKNKGRTIGYIIEEYIGRTGKKLFLMFCWLFCILVVAAFADVVARHVQRLCNGGRWHGEHYRRKRFCRDYVHDIHTRSGRPGHAAALWQAQQMAQYRNRTYTAGGRDSAGLWLPMYVSQSNWHIIVFIYVLIASVTPIWALLQPRDYLNSYLLVAMIVAAVIGVFVAQPAVNLPAFTGFFVGGQSLFPFLFVTIACGAVSGFHSLVSLGHGVQADKKRAQHAAGILWRNADGIAAGGDSAYSCSVVHLAFRRSRAGHVHPPPRCSPAECQTS